MGNLSLDSRRAFLWLVAALLLGGLPLRPAQAQPAAATPAAEPATLITHEMLDEGLALAQQHLLTVQTEHGDFEYEFDFITDENSEANQPTRQAAGVWALAMLYRDNPTPELRAAVLKGLQFFQVNSLPCEQGTCVVYPLSRTGRTGTQALVCLAEIEFLRAESAGETADEVRAHFEDHLAFLLSLRRDDGLYYSTYNLITGQGDGETSPFADGEVLFTLAQSAAYLGYDNLVPQIMETAQACWQAYVLDTTEADDDLTARQFYQWGSLAYEEIVRAGWPGSQPYAARTVQMCHTMLEFLNSPEGPKVNRAASYEGIIPAWRLALHADDAPNAALLAAHIRRGMARAMQFQVGHSHAGEFIAAHEPASQRALGGCLWYPRDPKVRIDAVVHQTHAMLLAREFLEQAGATPAAEEPQLPAIVEPAAKPETAQPELTREMLDASLDLARQHMLSVQTERGDFYYEFDFVTGDLSGGNNQVRQAGGLWGLALLHHDQPTEATREAVLRGIRFWHEHSRPAEAGGMLVVYPGEEIGKTGTQALVALAEIEFLRAELPGEDYDEVAGYLNEHLAFLLSLQYEDGRFPGAYDLETGAGQGKWSPYSDGESLLALAKAAAYLNREDLVPNILLAADSMWNSYSVVPAQAGDTRTPLQFYQWGSMAFYEIYKAGWEGSEPYAQRAIELAHERLEELATPRPNQNYATRYEGLTVAWESARLSGDTQSQEAIGRQILLGIPGVMTYQVGNPLANEFIQANPPGSEVSHGGCQFHGEDRFLRIDGVQHTANALLLTRRYLFDGP